MLVDTHCHLDDPRFAGRLPDIRRRAAEAGIGRIIIPGTGPASWAQTAVLARADKQLYPAFGLHPMLADQYTSALLATLQQHTQDAVALGEIGLDYSLADPSRETQIAAFRAQLRLAIKVGLPVMIHCRNAFHDLLNILREERAAQVGGVLHAFSGSPETAAECIKLGFAIAIAGTVTWHNAVRPLQVVAATPLEHLLLETDAPDLTPEPHRGQGNEPAFLLETARKVAEIKGIPLAEVAAVTTANAVKLFRLP
jgi:TatD DNase family protein